MAAIAKTYTLSDPVQDGDPFPPPGVADENVGESGDHPFDLNDVIDTDVDLESLFGDSRSEIFNFDLISNDQIFSLENVAPQTDNHDGAGALSHLGNDASDRSVLSISFGQYQDSAHPRAMSPPKLTLPSDPPRRAHVLTLPKTPPKLPDAQKPLSYAAPSAPQVVLTGTTALSSKLLMSSQTYSPQVVSHTGLAQSVTRPRHFVQNVSIPVLSRQPLTTVPQQTQLMLDQAALFDQCDSPGSTGSSLYSAYTPSDVRSTPEIPSTAGARVVSDYNSSVRSWAVQVGCDTDAGAKTTARKIRSDKLPKSRNQPSHDTLRRTVQLDKHQYQAMIEDAASYMLDARNPERYKDAITIRSRLNTGERKDHDAKLQFHAASLLDSGIGEKFWAGEPKAHTQAASKWPYCRVDLMFTLPQILTRICRDHSNQQKKTNNRARITRSTLEAEKIAREARDKVMSQREDVKTDSDDIECHITFVLFHDHASVIRRKIIVSVAQYRKYMDLINFLVSLIQDEYHIAGFSVVGPLGDAKINHQGDWDTILQVIGSTPRMASVALCMAEVVPKKSPPVVKVTGGTSQVIVLD